MTLTLDELDSHLFKCADIIRNAVDKTDYKDFILPLVFYKTINDTYEDEYQRVLEEEADGDEEVARINSEILCNSPLQTAFARVHSAAAA